jgi:putative oxidoreductase
MKFLEDYTDLSYVLLRVVSGGIFALNGVQKLFGVLAEHQPSIGSQVWLGGVVELVCGFLIVIGFQSRWAALLASGTMAVAYAQFHWKFRLAPGFFPVIKGGDAAIVYCLVFLYIACRGGGIWALDKSS